MRIAPLPEANYTFNASAKTIQFTTTGGIGKPLSLAHILHITNGTQGKLVFQPQGELTGAYNFATGVLTLGFDTTSHNNSDKLFIVIDDGTFVTSVEAKTDNSWITLRNWSSPASPVPYNTRPASNLFQTVTGLTATTMQLEIRATINASPSTSYRLYVWIDDGTEIYCVSPSGGNSGENGISSLDVNGPFDAVAPVIIDLRRYTPSIKVAAVICLDPAAVVFDINGNAINPGFIGGERVLYSTSGVLPQGIAGRITSINATEDTFTYTGTSLFDGDLVRINLTQIGTGVVPYLGLSARGRCSDVDVSGDWLVLDGIADINLAVGDTVRFRSGSGQTLPAVAGSAISTTTTYTIVARSGNQIKISIDGIAPLNITSAGIGIYYVFKFPYIYCYMKGTNQLSWTAGGAAINFVAQHTGSAVTVTAGTAASISHSAHGFANGKELMMTGTTVPTGSSQGQRFYVKNQTTNAYQLALTPTGPAVAFTGAGTAVQVVDTATGVASSVTVTAGTPGSISLPLHWLGTANRFILGGATLPGDYTGQTLWVLTTTTGSLTFSENKTTPCVFSSAGTAVTLSAAGTDWSEVAIEQLAGFVASSPVPTDNKISLAATANGSALVLSGGVGSHSFVDAANLQIKAGSKVIVRAM